VLGGIVRGKRVTLRTTTEADLTDHLRWHADAEATAWMPERPRPQSLDQRKEWLKEIGKDESQTHYEIAEGDSHIGYCSFKVEWPRTDRIWSMGTLFLAPEARGRGLGADAARALHRFAIDYHGLERGDVWLYRDDVRGRRLFESLGYVEYAHGHEVFYREGRYWDDWRAYLEDREFRRRFPEEREYPERGPK
jgi:RimJ/RimL family protein N-acetyltransferase